MRETIDPKRYAFRAGVSQLTAATRCRYQTRRTGRKPRPVHRVPEDPAPPVRRASRPRYAADDASGHDLSAAERACAPDAAHRVTSNAGSARTSPGNPTPDLLTE